MMGGDDLTFGWENPFGNSYEFFARNAAGKKVGFMKGVYSEEQEAFLVDLIFVDPPYQRQGLARRFFEMAAQADLWPFIHTRATTSERATALVERLMKDQPGQHRWASKTAAWETPKLDRWQPENDRQAAALARLKSKPTMGSMMVDGEMVHDAIRGSAPFEDDIRDDFDEAEIDRLPRKTMMVPTQSIIATKQYLKRNSIAAVIHGLDNPTGPFARKGYLPIAIRVPGGKLFLWDGHHRLEGAILLGQRSTEVEVIDLSQVTAGLNAARKLYEEVSTHKDTPTMRSMIPPDKWDEYVKMMPVKRVYRDGDMEVHDFLKSPSQVIDRAFTLLWEFRKWIKEIIVGGTGGDDVLGLHIKGFDQPITLTPKAIMGQGISGYGWMPSAKKDYARYILAHEVGHSVEPPNLTDALWDSQAWYAISEYGRMENDPREAWAECFAEWYCSGGRTTNLGVEAVRHLLERTGVTPKMGAKTAAVTVKDYEGRVGESEHITRIEEGTIPTAAIADLRGVRGEVPGAHRNRQGADWDAFLEDIGTNGITNPIFITVDYGDEPKISEGNHRRDAAVDLGLPEVPVEIRYFGHAEQQGSVAERRMGKTAAFNQEMSVQDYADDWWGGEGVGGWSGTYDSFWLTPRGTIVPVKEHEEYGGYGAWNLGGGKPNGLRGIISPGRSKQSEERTLVLQARLTFKMERPGARPVEGPPLVTLEQRRAALALWQALDIAKAEFNATPGGKYGGETTYFTAPAALGNHLRGLEPTAKTAGPSSGVIPWEWRDDPLTPVELHAPMKVVFDRVGLKDLHRADPGLQKKVQEAVEQIERGRAELEPKLREPLQGTYSVRLTDKARMLVYPHIDGALHVYAVLPSHDYDEAERRMSDLPDESQRRVAKVLYGTFGVEEYLDGLLGGQFRSGNQSYDSAWILNDGQVAAVDRHEAQGFATYRDGGIRVVLERRNGRYARIGLDWELDSMVTPNRVQRTTIASLMDGLGIREAIVSASPDKVMPLGVQRGFQTPEQLGAFLRGGLVNEHEEHEKLFGRVTKAASESWAVYEVPIERLLPLVREKLHERDVPEREYLDDLKAKIARDGITKPITVTGDYDGNVKSIWDGNHRVTVAAELGLPTVPTRLLPEMAARWGLTKTAISQGLQGAPRFVNLWGKYRAVVYDSLDGDYVAIRVYYDPSDEAVCGTLNAHKVGGKWEVDMISVHPDDRRQGLGEWMLSELARMKGKRNLTSDSWSDRGAALWKKVLGEEVEGGGWVRNVWGRLAADIPRCPRCGGLDAGGLHFDGDQIYRGVMVESVGPFATADPVKLAKAFEAHFTSFGGHYSREAMVSIGTFALPTAGETGFFLTVDSWRCEDTIPVDPGYSHEQEIRLKPGAKVRLLHATVYPDPALRPADYSKYDRQWDITRLLTRKTLTADLRGDKLWWRVHPAGRREFTPEMATSTPFGQEATPRTGFSCYKNPWHLWYYLEGMFGFMTGDDPVIGFTGQRVGEGWDGEDLVVPDGNIVLTYTFEQFERELAKTPLPPTPGPPGNDWGCVPNTWERWITLHIRGNTEDPPTQAVLEHFGYHRVWGEGWQKAAVVHGTMPAREWPEWVWDQGADKRMSWPCWIKPDGQIIAVDAHEDLGYQTGFHGGYIRAMVNPTRSIYQDPMLGLEWWLNQDPDFVLPTESQRRAIITLINEFGLESYWWSVSNADGRAIDSGSTRSKAELGNYLRSSVYASKTAALDLESWISVAEHAMENHGVVGRTFDVPTGHQDDPAYQERIKPYVDFARKALASEGMADEWVNVCTSDYILKREGYPNALVTPSNLIVLRPTSNEMTILHEVAHIVTRSPEGSHTRQFVEVVHRLYTKFLDARAGEVFWNLVGDKFVSKTAAPYKRTGIPKPGLIYRGMKVDFPSEVQAQIDAALEMPMEEEQIGQHFKAGPIILDYIQHHHWDREMGLGRHWTGRKEMAVTAAWNGPGVGIVLTAQWDGSGLDTTDDERGYGMTLDTESEATLLPGTPIEVVGVEIMHYSQWRQVLKAPIRATAAAFDPDRATVRFFHGTNQAALDQIRRDGVIKHITMDQIVNEVAKNTGLDPAAIWADDHMTFLRSRRSEDPQISLTQDAGTAAEYAKLGSESLAYTLSAAHKVLTKGDMDPRAFKEEYARKHGLAPVVLTLDIPWSWLRKYTYFQDWNVDADKWDRASGTFVPSGGEEGAWKRMVADSDITIFTHQNPYTPIPAAFITSTKRVGARQASAQTIRLFHGTNQAALDAIRSDGQFRPADHHRIATEIEDRYGLPRDSVWDSSSYQFNKGFRAGDQTVYFTTDLRTATEYATIGSEAINDALNGAFILIHDAFDEEGMFKPGMGEAKSPWVKAETTKHYAPVVLTVEVPFEVYVAAHGDRWRGGPPTPEEVHGDIALPAPIPASWIVGVTKVGRIGARAAVQAEGVLRPVRGGVEPEHQQGALLRGLPGDGGHLGAELLPHPGPGHLAVDHQHLDHDHHLPDGGAAGELDPALRGRGQSQARCGHRVAQ